jgi:uncharacterized protein
MNVNQIIVGLFARAPVQGQVKTRLAPFVGEDGALLLHKCLIKHVFETSLQAFPETTEIWVSSKENKEYFLSLCTERNILFQEGADLGERMAHAIRSILSRAGYAILIGADCLSVSGDYLREAGSLLSGGERLVLGPAEDGGYVLIGISGMPAEDLEFMLQCLFIDMPWGTPDVMAETRSRLQQSGLSWKELSTRWDVDRPEDLLRVREALPDEAALQALLRPDLLSAIASQSDSR